MRRHVTGRALKCVELKNVCCWCLLRENAWKRGQKEGNWREEGRGGERKRKGREREGEGEGSGRGKKSSRRADNVALSLFVATLVREKESHQKS